MMLRKATVLLVCLIVAVSLLTGCGPDGEVSEESKNEKSLIPASSSISGKPIEKADEPIAEFHYKNESN